MRTEKRRRVGRRGEERARGLSGLDLTLHRYLLLGTKGPAPGGPLKKGPQIMRGPHRENRPLLHPPNEHFVCFE